ncbi:hypothetical protein V8F06_002275 [Rhypophila decipiens]
MRVEFNGSSARCPRLVKWMSPRERKRPRVIVHHSGLSALLLSELSWAKDQELEEGGKETECEARKSKTTSLNGATVEPKLLSELRPGKKKEVAATRNDGAVCPGPKTHDAKVAARYGSAKAAFSMGGQSKLVQRWTRGKPQRDFRNGKVKTWESVDVLHGPTLAGKQKKERAHEWTIATLPLQTGKLAKRHCQNYVEPARATHFREKVKRVTALRAHSRSISRHPSWTATTALGYLQKLMTSNTSLFLTDMLSFTIIPEMLMIAPRECLCQ